MSLVLLVLAVLVYASFTPLVRGSPIYTPGLRAGDNAWYGYSGIAVPVMLHVVVLNVVGTRVNANFTYYSSNGQVSSATLYVDIFNGDNNTSSVLFATGTGLKVGDPVYNTGPNIVSVQTQFCGGVQRTTDYVVFPQKSVQEYWDQNTGLMCSYGAPNQSLIMSNTTLWDSHPPAADPFLVGFEVSTLLGAPLVVLIVFVYLRKRRRARR
jgi:hypothetical protein